MDFTHPASNTEETPLSPSEWSDTGINTPVRTRAQSPENLAQLQFPRKNTPLAGVSFANAPGRHVCLYYQNKQGHIYEACFLWEKLAWSLQTIVRIGTEAKPYSPLTAVTWANGYKRCLFYLNYWNIICELTTTNGGATWTDGSLNILAIPTRDTSSLASSIQCHDSMKPISIGLYYQDWDNMVREVRFEGVSSSSGERRGEWVEGTMPPEEAAGGTPIAAHDQKIRWAYTMSRDGTVQERYRTEKWYELARFEDGPKYGEKFAVCGNRKQVSVFVHDGTQVHEMAYDKEAWRQKGPVRGSKSIEKEFVALSWAKEGQVIEQEFHLISLNGVNMYYCVLGHSDVLQASLLHT